MRNTNWEEIALMTLIAMVSVTGMFNVKACGLQNDMLQNTVDLACVEAYTMCLDKQSSEASCARTLKECKK